MIIKQIVHACVRAQRRSQDLGGGVAPGTFSVTSGSRPDSVGGGVVAEIFRDLLVRTRFSGGCT